MTVIFDPIRLKQVLSETLSQVFSQMVFLDARVLPDESALTAVESQIMECVAIDVLKPVSLRLEFRFNSSLKNKVVNSLFNEAEMTQGDDSLLEILNVSTGNFLFSYFGPQTEIKMELPEYLYSEEKRDSVLVASSSFDVEGSYLIASLFSMRYHY